MRTVLRRLAGAWSPAAVLLATTLAACGGDGSDPLAPGAAPQREIRDAARNCGTPGFHFISPIAPTLPTYPGTFDPARFTAVEICVWSGTACTGPLVARYAGTDVQVNTTGQHYRVDWPTTGLSNANVYRIRVLEGARELGHADAKIPAAGETPTSLTAQGIVPLGNGSRLAIRYRLEVPPPNATPVVTIVAPADGAVIPVGQPITLTGTASDAEDGDRSSQLVWRSDRLAEPIGTGASILAPLPGGRHTVSASVTDAGGATGTASRQLVVSIVTVSATLNVGYGATASLPITLTEPAPAGGLTLAVASSAPDRVGIVTSTVTVPAGAQSASATVRGAAPGSATVTVSHPDYGAASAQVATTAQLDITQPSVSFPQGRSGPITIALRSGGTNVAAPAGGLTVNVASSNPGCAAVASTVTIPEGLVDVTTTVTHGGSAATPCSASVTASAAGLPEITTDVVTVSIAPAPVITVGAVGRVGSGLRSTSTGLSLGAPAPAGGVTVTLTSADPSTLLLSEDATSVGTASVSLTIAAGNTSASFHAHALAGTTGTVAITATAPGYASGSVSATVVPAAVEIQDIDATTTSLAPNDPFTVRVGPVDAAGTGMSGTQVVRPGGSAITVTVSNGSAAVAQLVTSAGSAQSRTVTIAAGASSSPSTVAAGGIALDPLGGGTTTLTASAPGHVSATTATRTVTVSASSLTVHGGGTRIGAGLRAGSSSISLSAGAPAGGVAVTLTSADPSKLLVSDGSAASVGAASVTLTVTAGNTSVAYAAHAVEGQTGAVAITATAAGYTSASATMSIVPAAVEIIDVDATTTSQSLNDAFRVRVGAVNTAGDAIFSYQDVRPGGAPITVTVANSNATVAQLVTSAGVGQTRTVTLQPGEGISSSTVGTGGIALDLLAGGTTTVTASAPGVVSTASATRTVTVSAPRIAVNAGSARVGAGLRTNTGAMSISIDAPAPAGGLPVTITSGDESTLLLSTGSGTTEGTASTTATIPAGSQTLSFYGHGVEGARGAVTVTATAPGYTAGSGSMTVAPAGIEITGAPASTTTLSSTSPFVARVGPMPASGASLATIQDVRPGGTPIVVTVTSSNPAVGQLATSAGAGQTRTVTISIGQSNSPSSVAAGGVAFDPIGSGTTTLTASAPGLTSSTEATRTVTVSAPEITIGIGAPTVGAGLRTTQQSIQLGAPAPAGGLPVTLTSSSPGVLLVSDIGATSVGTGTVTLTVPAGTTVVGFYTHGVEGQRGTATLTASAAGYTNGTGSVTVRGVGLRVINLPGTTTAGSANTLFRAQVGVLNGAGTDLFNTQDVRPGGTPIVVTMTNANAAVAQLVTSAGAAQARTVTIPTGSDASPTSVAAGGVAFDPLAAGSTTVTATAPGIAPIASATQPVTVTP
ncbi:MAG: beta strand repeat-containing protein [Gemmatirosa sp.]